MTISVFVGLYQELSSGIGSFVCRKGIKATMDDNNKWQANEIAGRGGGYG